VTEIQQSDGTVETDDSISGYSFQTLSLSIHFYALNEDFTEYTRYQERKLVFGKVRD
jgi:hypothetical protein